jgi:UMF1 family MFS transporter
VSPSDQPVQAAQAPVGRAGIAGWLMFDWASQPVHTLIITFVYGPFFVSAIASSPEQGQALWGYATAAAAIAIALLSPVLGSMADASGPRKSWIAGFSILLVIGATGLWFAVPGAPGAISIALGAYIICLIGVEFATVFTNAMMPDLVPEDRLGRLSGNGWAVGYVGGLVSLVIMLGLMAASPESGRTLLGLEPILGLDPATRDGDRAAGPLSAIWYIVFIIPLFVFTPDMARKCSLAASVHTGLSELRATLRQLPGHRNMLTFLLASLLYRDGLIALFAFGGIYAAGVLGWSTIQIGIFGIVLTITGTFGALVGGVLDDRIGPKKVVIGALVILFFCSLGVISTSRDHIFFVIEVTQRQAGDPLFSSAPEIVYLIFGGLIGAAAGPMQAASRTLLVRLSPRAQMTQFFGIYALTGKATSFAGPLAIGLATQLSGSQQWGITPMLVLFGTGAVVLFMVRVERTEI